MVGEVRERMRGEEGKGRRGEGREGERGKRGENAAVKFVYFVFQGAVDGFTRALAIDEAKYHVRVNR